MELLELPHMKVVLAIMTLSVIILGGLINLVEPHLSPFIRQTFRYGKFAYKGPASKSPLLKPIEVPKRWFKHFYVFATVYTTYILWVAFSVYCRGITIPEWFKESLDFLYTKNRTAAVPAGHVLVALMLLCAQCWRRLYETFFVSVFSEGRINLPQYICGFMHYLGAASAIVSEAPQFTATTSEATKNSGLTLASVAAVGVFLWCFVHQFRCAVILANLRKNKDGKVAHTKHVVPNGDWFEWVSSPHLLAEILMYCSLSVLLWPNSAWNYVLLWVICNQVETALLSHWWYKDTFKDYPATRKAVIPFIL